MAKKTTVGSIFIKDVPWHRTEEKLPSPKVLSQSQCRRAVEEALETIGPWDEKLPSPVPCERCGQPSGVYPATMRANSATSVVCATCLRGWN